MYQARIRPHFVSHFVVHFVVEWTEADKVLDEVEDKVVESASFGVVSLVWRANPLLAWLRKAIDLGVLDDERRAYPRRHLNVLQLHRAGISDH